jgi:tRNA-specific 2-thiouridylase
MRVAAKLNISLVTLDLGKEYKAAVVDYMLAEYKAGRTPNPDVECNRHIKFGLLYNWAMQNGADFVATGHYAQSDVKNQQLLAGADKNKDQSYFLWAIKREQLTKILFPIGTLEKSEVRKLATKFGLPNAARPDSQGLCFVGQLDIKTFLQEFVATKPGQVLNELGEVIGTHDGAIFYTLGERHGFTVTKKTANDEPYYVVSKNMVDNTITVSAKNNISSANKLLISNPNWLAEPKLGKQYQARVRYRAALLPCVIMQEGKNTIVEFAQAPDFITPGQSVVIYDGEQVVGGGIIA